MLTRAAIHLAGALFAAFGCLAAGAPAAAQSGGSSCAQPMTLGGGPPPPPQIDGPPPRCGGVFRFNLGAACVSPTPPRRETSPLREAVVSRCEARELCATGDAARNFADVALFRTPDAFALPEAGRRLVAAASVGQSGEDAEALMEQAASLDPRNADVYRAYALMTEWRAARSMRTERAARLLEALGPVAEIDARVRADVLLAQAGLAVERGLRDDGVALARAALALEPAFYQAHVLIATATIASARAAAHLDAGTCRRRFTELFVGLQAMLAVGPCAEQIARFDALATAASRDPEQDAALNAARAMLSAVLGHQAGWRAARRRVLGMEVPSSCGAHVVALIDQTGGVEEAWR